MTTATPSPPSTSSDDLTVVSSTSSESSFFDDESDESDDEDNHHRENTYMQCFLRSFFTSAGGYTKFVEDAAFAGIKTRSYAWYVRRLKLLDSFSKYYWKNIIQCNRELMRSDAENNELIVVCIDCRWASRRRAKEASITAFYKRNIIGNVNLDKARYRKLRDYNGDPLGFRSKIRDGLSVQVASVTFENIGNILLARELAACNLRIDVLVHDQKKDCLKLWKVSGHGLVLT